MKFTSICMAFFYVLLFVSCDTSDEQNTEFAYGKNLYTTTIDGDEREYYVHVPTGYEVNNPIPVVFMLHGARGKGEGTYTKSGWKEVGEDENILTVFPTAWSYCWIKSSGVVKENATRWNSFPGIFNFCSGEQPRDDIKFLSTVISELKDNFNVDGSRIYMAGFSSGGQMSFRCAVEMSDLIAAIVQSGGTHQKANIMTPVREIPVALELGNRDLTWFDPGMQPPLELFDELLDQHSLHKRIIEIHAGVFGFETEYKMEIINEQIAVATFEGIPDEERTFKYTLVDGLDHSYPNGDNHSFQGAKHHWEFMKKYKKEN